MIKPISNLKPKEYVSKQFVVNRFEVRTNSIGKRFLFLVLSDDSGSVRAVFFDAFEDSKILNIEKGVVLFVQGKVETNNGDISIKMSDFYPIFDKNKIEYSHFMDSFENLDEQINDLFKTIDSIKDNDYKKLLSKLFSSKKFLDKFKIYPAAKTWHHAKIGGLIVHTMETVKICNFLTTMYNEMDRDLLVTSAILHDIGKTEEFTVDVTREYSDSGKLIGHISLGAQMISKAIDSISGFDKIKKDLIIHQILSHHGKYEYQSPVLPKTIEAFALNLADDMSAKMNALGQIKGKERIDKGWSSFNRLLERAMFFHKNDEDISDKLF